MQIKGEVGLQVGHHPLLQVFPPHEVVRRAVDQLVLPVNRGHDCRIRVIGSQHFLQVVNDQTLPGLGQGIDVGLREGTPGTLGPDLADKALGLEDDVDPTYQDDQLERERDFFVIIVIGVVVADQLFRREKVS